MRSLLFGFLLALSVILAPPIYAQNVPTMEPPPKVASLGVADLISQDEVDRLWLYYNGDSNSVREEAQAAMKAARGNFNDPQVVRAWAKVTALDEAVHGTISKLIRNGYWLKTEGRNATFDKAVWLALQHIFDPELVDLTLVQIKPLISKGLVSGEGYALMYDRNELRHERPQVYGSQFQCRDGRAVVEPLLDPEHVDERRKQMGMQMHFADYETLMQEQCAR